MTATLRARKEFKVIVGTTPRLLVGATDRHACVFSNEGPATVYLGSNVSTTGTWMALTANQGFTDDLTLDPWYARTTSSSGTITGWYV
jgi:hypothetical protein